MEINEIFNQSDSATTSSNSLTYTDTTFTTPYTYTGSCTTLFWPYYGCKCSNSKHTIEEIAEMQKLALAINPNNEDQDLPDFITLLKMARKHIRELEKAAKKK